MPIDLAGESGNFTPLFDWAFLMKTHLPKVNLDQRKWHVIDADGAVLGRLAVQVADILPEPIVAAVVGLIAVGTTVWLAFFLLQ